MGYQNKKNLMVNATKFHSCTVLFAKSVYEKAVLINNSWTNMQHIQASHPPKQKTPTNMYRDYGQTFSYKKEHFIGIQEENAPSNFAPLIKKGVKVEPYDFKNLEHKPVYFPQENPDIIFNFKDSQFKDKRIHALDQKTNNPGLGKNKILSEISEVRYESTITRVQKEFLINFPPNNEIQKVLKDLKNTCNDLTAHQLVWAQNLHLFPDNFIPPLKIPQNFSYSQLTPEALREIKIAELRMKKVSDFLYAKKVPQINHGTFSKEALDFLQDSEMQRLLSQDFSNFI